MSDDLIEKIARAILETDPTCDYDACRHNYAHLPDGHLQKNWWESLHKSARAALSAIDRSGTHAVVPVELTTGMESALNSYAMCAGYIPKGYAAMLSARPPLPDGGKT